MDVSSVSGAQAPNLEAALLKKAHEQQKLEGKAALDLIQSASPQPVAQSGHLGRHVNTVA